MKPRPFVPKDLPGDKPYVRDEAEGLVWHCCRLRSLYADTDRSQVVYHSNYLIWCEIGRTELIRALGTPYAELERQNVTLAVVEASMRFHSAAR